ncbi:DUF983 domain-containing protein [Donghicola tyrosinivorans]|uniref:Uncharacterized protein (DUF983 family) n=1 Tax=Donghicola tyrosinivorans TaxID=1652492 RepID=A0A2T0WEB2_9RHOB|nr:DUF983 domain-containing protein [Donghicola tyrosinivorans]PRY85048.1 uncharacterized protein (DUF983 family) [Donghicola tyrosinivorans]
MTKQDTTPERDMKTALLNGLRLRCPCCGEGKLFRGYLKVADHCQHCGQDFTAQRADDGPAYVVILIMCHIMGVVLHLTFNGFRDDPLTLALILAAVAIAASLVMLPPVKGAFVAIQWAKRMHGF